MKQLLTALSILISVTCISQPVSNRSSSSLTIADSRLMAFLNLYIPKYTDTTAANLQKGIDSCGAIIFTYTGNKIWKRSCNPKKWQDIAPTQLFKIFASYGLSNVNDSTLKVDTTLISTLNKVFRDSNYLKNLIDLRELLSNKVTTITSPNATDYPTTGAVNGFVASSISGKLNISDTSGMLSSYQTAINARLKLSDSAIYQPKFRSDSARSNLYTSLFGKSDKTTTVAGFPLSSNIALADLTATNPTLTFSGAYNGSTARTIGINLANVNTWTAAQTFTQPTTISNTSVGGTYGTAALNVNGSGVFNSSVTSFSLSSGYIQASAGLNVLNGLNNGSGLLSNRITNSSNAATQILVGLSIAAVTTATTGTLPRLVILDVAGTAGANTITTAGQTVTNAIGVNIPTFTAGVNNAFLSIINPSGSPIGNWSIYNAGAFNNYFASKLLIGTTTDAGFTGADINGTVRIQNTLTATKYQLPALNTPPASSTDTGTTGEIRWANGFVYLCVATNTWQRAALSTF